MFSTNLVRLFLYILINFASNYFPLFTLFIEKLKRSRCVNGCFGTCAFRHVSRVPRVAPVSVMSKSTSERWLVVPTVPVYDICPDFLLYLINLLFIIIISIVPSVCGARGASFYVTVFMFLAHALYLREGLTG